MMRTPLRATERTSGSPHRARESLRKAGSRLGMCVKGEGLAAFLETRRQVVTRNREGEATPTIRQEAPGGDSRMLQSEVCTSTAGMEREINRHQHFQRRGHRAGLTDHLKSLQAEKPQLKERLEIFKIQVRAGGGAVVGGPSPGLGGLSWRAGPARFPGDSLGLRAHVFAFYLD